MLTLNHRLAVKHATVSLRTRAFIRLLSFKTYPTPNENALKFESSVTVSPAGNNTFEFYTTLQAVHSPLALKLFKLPGIRSLMIGNNFVTINKQDYVNWAHLRPEVIEILDKFLTSKDEPVITKELMNQKDSLTVLDDDSEIVAMIKELIDTRIRPAIQDDGGDIEFQAFDEETGKVFIKLQGACKSCSSSEDTLKGGIEAMLKHYIEEVTGVEQILAPEEEIGNKEFERLEFKLKNKARAGSGSSSSSAASSPPSL